MIHDAAVAQVKDPRPVTAIILAAGRSTRMGRPKQRIVLDGRTLLRHVIDNALAAGLAPVVVVLGHEAEAIRTEIEAAGREPRLHIVVNPAYAEGQSSSLATGLATLGPDADAVAVLLADQPGVGPTLIRRVVAEYRAAGARMTRPIHPDPSQPAAGRDEARGNGDRRARTDPASNTRHGVPGHPVILSREIWPELLALRGDEGARALARRHPEWLHCVPVDVEAPADMDTPEDLARIER